MDICTPRICCRYTTSTIRDDVLRVRMSQGAIPEVTPGTTWRGHPLRRQQHQRRPRGNPGYRLQSLGFPARRGFYISYLRMVRGQRPRPAGIHCCAIASAVFWRLKPSLAARFWSSGCGIRSGESRVGIDHPEDRTSADCWGEVCCARLV